MSFLLLLTAALIFAAGQVMIFSTTSAEILDQNLDINSYNILIRQFLYAILGLIVGYAVWKAGCRQLMRVAPFLLVLCTFFLLLALVPGVGKEVNGSRRWITFFGVSLQPSEFVKFILPLFFIDRLRHCRKFKFREFVESAFFISLPVILILLEPNNGTVAVILLTLVALFFLTAVPLKYWALPIIASVIVVGSLAYNLPYVSKRLQAYYHPEADIFGKGHQPYQAKVAAGSGGFLGKGPGQSWQKLSFLPEAQNDYIAAIAAEEFGFLGMVVIIFLYMSFAYLGFSLAAGAKSREGFFLAAITTCLISLQAFLNLAVVSGLLPATGLNLPLFSQGGSSLVANSMGIGMILSVGREP